MWAPHKSGFEEQSSVMTVSGETLVAAQASLEPAPFAAHATQLSYDVHAPPPSKKKTATSGRVVALE